MLHWRLSFHFSIQSITKAHHKLLVNLAAKLYTTVASANLTAQLIINFQFITGAKVVLFYEITKETTK